MTHPELTLSFTLPQLRGLIGRRVRYRGADCQIIEVLEDEPAVILQDCEQHTMIQPDQLGEAHRRVPSTFTVPILSGDRSEINPAFLELNLLDS
ncbi:MAG: hypothetical protein ACOY4D_02725 [Pseudomonadota bacterium]